MCSLAAWLLVASALHMTTAGPPVFGTKRYARGWAGVSPYYGGVRLMAPYYATDYDMDYYYQDPPYPAYTYYPYYRPYPYGYGYEDPVNTAEAIAAAAANDEEHADYGMETWYDSHSSEADNNARANALFLQNLILANMYNDQNSYNTYRPFYSYQQFPNSEDDDDGTWVYGEPVRSTSGANSVSKEDEDVRELKELVSNKEARKEELFRVQREGGKKWQRNGQRKRQDNVGMPVPSTTENPAPVTGKTAAKMGQLEVVLPRPAGPSRNAIGFHKTVNSRTPHTPSVYDTIKQLLQMQERLQDDEVPERKSKPQKRSYIPSEENLVAQLGILKKTAA